MKCPECDKINEVDAKFCEYCGIEFKADSLITSGMKMNTKEDNKHIIFISHAEADKKIVKCFREMIELILHPYPSLKYEIFCSSGIGDIECGDDSRDKIHDKLNRSDNVFCILTKNSYDRPWVMYEIGYTQGKSSDKNKKKLMPIAIDISIKTITNEGYPYSNFFIYECNKDRLSALMIQFLNKIIPNYSNDKQLDKLNKSFAPYINEFLKKIKIISKYEMSKS